MAITQIKGSNIEDGTVVAADVADGAVTDAKLAATLNLSGKTVTLPAASVTAHAVTPTLDSPVITGVLSLLSGGNVTHTVANWSDDVQGQRSRFWKPMNLGALSEQDVMNVLKLTEKAYRVNPKRVYLMGHSMGGGGTLHLGMKYPGRWAALAPIAPAIYRSPRGLTAIRDTPEIVV